MVLPSRIWLLVMPTSVATVPALELPQAPAMISTAAAIANRGPVPVIRLPPYFPGCLSHSLRIGWQLSSCPFADSPQPVSQPGICRQYQSDQPVRGEDHDQDQERSVGDGRAGVPEHRRHLVRYPVLALHELARHDGQPEREDAAQPRPGDRAKAADDGPDQELQGEAERERVWADVARGEAVERAGDAGVEGGQAEGQRLVPGDVDPEGGGRDLAVANGHERPAGTPADDVPGDPEEDEHEREGDVVEPLLAGHARAAGDGGEGRARPVGRVHRREDDALGAEGEALRALDEAWRDHRQREGGEGEIQRRE